MIDYKVVKDFVKNAVTPLTLTRLGDGEARILNWREDKASAEYMLKKHMGFIPSDDKVLEIRDNLITAFNKSDIIGVPTEKHKRKGDKYWREAEGMMYEFAPGSLDSVRCSIDIHTDWLVNDVYDELLRDEEEVYIVTCRDVAKGLEEKYNIGKVHQFLISEQWHYDLEKKDNRHYPDEFNEINAWIKSLNLNLNYCMIGAGFVGKIYGVWFKDAGGKSLDIGHIFDKWSGMVTRGVGGRIGVTSDEYKL